MDPIKQARRAIVLVVGSTVLLAGVVLLVLPGPAFVVIPVGLAILSTEFVWAARLLKRVKDNAAYAAQAVMGAPTGTRESVWSRMTSWLAPKRAPGDASAK